MRVTAQLIDATTGGHLWAERYDRPEADLFAIQDEVAQNVASALGGWYGRLNKARRGGGQAPAAGEPGGLRPLPARPGAEAQVHQGEHGGGDPAVLARRRARPRLRAGLDHAGGGLHPLGHERLRRRSARRQPALRRGHKKAAELDPFDPFTQAMLGCVRGLEGDPKGAEAAFDRAVALAPNDPDTLLVVAWSLPLIVGRADEAVRHGRRAMALDPASPAVYAPALAVAQYAAGEYEEAVATLRLAPLEGGELLMYWAMAQAQLGHVEEAREAAERIRTEFPSFTVEGYIRDFPVTAPAALAAIREGAAKAGLLPAATQ